MPEYSRPLGDTVKRARKEKGLTQKQTAEAIGIDDRTISNMEIYYGNPKLEILHPLVRFLKIDPNDIFYPELRKESSVHNQLRVLISNCTEEEAEALIPICESVLSALRRCDGISVE